MSRYVHRTFLVAYALGRNPDVSRINYLDAFGIDRNSFLYADLNRHDLDHKPGHFSFFYYIFYVTGVAAYNALGWNISAMNFARISEVIVHSDSLGFYEGLKYWSRFLINDMGAPMFLGSFLIGVPSAIVGYPLTKVFINGFRKKQATKEGISLKEWEDKYVRKEANKNVSIWNILKS